VLVVVIMLAILAGMIIPRLSTNDRRQFRLAVDQAADLLTMYAQRQSLGQKIVGLQQDAHANALQLLLLDYDNNNPGSPANWRSDVYVKPVKFPPFMRPENVEIWADGEYLDTSNWPLSTELGQDRPMIEIVLSGAGETARLVLAPYAVAPVNINDLRDGAGVRERIDLDASGQSREDW
jgi:type II secretory pathway pseudopilin PulG